MAYDRYAVELTDKDGQIYGVMDAEAREEVSELNSALTIVENDDYALSEMEASATSTGWRLIASDGLCVSNSGYKLLKFPVVAGDVIRVVSDDMFQFQNSSSVPSSGTSNRIGQTYQSGDFLLKVPINATYCIVSTPTTSNAHVYFTNAVINKVGYLDDLKLSYYEFANGYIYTDTTLTIGRVNGSGIPVYGYRGVYTEVLTYQQVKKAVAGSGIGCRFALYDANGDYVETYYNADMSNKTFVKARAFFFPTRTEGNSNATKEEIDLILNTAKIVSRTELPSAFAKESQVSNKVDKNGANQVKASNIDGSDYIATTISETVTEDSYWYATGSSTIASGGTLSGMDKAVFDISTMTGKIAFGFDAEASYGSGSFVLGLSSSSSSPYARVAYFSVSNITSSDYFEVDGNVAVVDLDALKTTYSTAVTLFVNIPHAKWLLENRVYTKKALHWLLMSGAVPAIVVAKDGTGDYASITEAVSHAKNEDTIFIKDGEYKETVIINKYIHLVGQSKQGTILYNDVGDYDHAPLLITQGSVCNMTIKSLAPESTSGLTDYAYAIHLDKNFATLAKYQKCEIYNCDIFSEVNDAIGAGTNYATKYDVHDCFLHVAHNPVKTGSCGFKCHNGTNQTTGKVTLRHNVIITEDANGTTCHDILFHNGGISNVQPIEILMVENVLKYYHNGITNIFVPSAYNYGNSVAEMNTLT